MPLIKLQTHILAPVERVFDLSRSIDLHQFSVSETHEKAITGKTSGLLELGETVTWRAKHLGIYQQLTVKMTSLEKPQFFVDEMQKGAFQSMKHLHKFDSQGDTTIMYDEFNFESPFGVIGKLFNRLYLENYMKSFLEIRNQSIKQIAESDEWSRFIRE
ncbi:SRPBCC family protein [Chondrinema litorale]|uniref:SRPBCC family protein n=1 Tax=Chondrinema litorale TaxID=2994555 RepID=UPI002543B8CE|nr:SRPBCC family protein [Chondrinema litorale]UZR97860.1 SRPBCC family protein [Chondrinema litorale]